MKIYTITEVSRFACDGDTASVHTSVAKSNDEAMEMLCDFVRERASDILDLEDEDNYGREMETVDEFENEVMSGKNEYGEYSYEGSDCWFTWNIQEHEVKEN